MVPMDHTPATYRAALQMTLRTTAAAYGYTLTIATSSAALLTVHGKPRTGDLFLFVAGGLIAFALLEVLLAAAPPSEERVEQVFPFAGSLNFVSVAGALGASIGLAHAIGPELAWLVAPLAATAVYMLLVAAQLTIVDLVRGRNG